MEFKTLSPSLHGKIHFDYWNHSLNLLFFGGWGAKFITFLSHYHFDFLPTLKSTAQILVWVRPNLPFWQCQDLESHASLPPRNHVDIVFIS